MTHGKLIAQKDLKFSCNKMPSSPKLNFPSHYHINSDPNLRFSTNRCISASRTGLRTSLSPLLRPRPLLC